MGTFNNFDSGLWIDGPRDQIPRNALRRARGVGPIKRGFLKSRNGSTLVYTVTGTAHSLFRFNDLRFHAITTVIYRSNTSLNTGHDGNRLAFVRMPPTTSIADYLFICGGGKLIKVDASGNVTNWGIAAPANGMAAAEGAAGNLNGAYKYRVTFLNSASGSRSNPNPTDVTITVTNKIVNLSAIPTSADAQVNAREIWRTVGNGAVLFRIVTIADNTTTTYADNVQDADVEALEMQTDNDVPPATVDDAVGPHEGRMWWTRRDVGGSRGRLYYSPIGRAEAFASFIDVTNDDDPIQKAVIWNGLYVFSESGLHQVIGTDEPFLPRRIYGAPGTTKPFTVKPTPFGIPYQANDGVRLFNGSTSDLVGFEAIGPIFRGEALENLTAFEGVIAEYARGEYIISDTSQTLALDLKTKTWRDLGIAVNALFYEDDADKLIAAIANKTIILEDEGTLTDDGVGIAYAVETPAELAHPIQTGLCNLIIIDIDPRSQVLTPTLVVDNTTVAFATITGSGRQKIEITPNQNGRVFGLRLTGTLTNIVDLFGVTLNIHAGR